MNFPTKQPKGGRDTIDNYSIPRESVHTLVKLDHTPTHPLQHTHTLWTITVNDYLLHTKFI